MQRSTSPVPGLQLGEIAALAQIQKMAPLERRTSLGPAFAAPPAPAWGGPSNHQGADDGAGRGVERHWLETVEEQEYERFPVDPIKLLEEAEESAKGQRSTPQVEEVSDEVMRLRLLKSQHDELRAKLSHTQAQLKQKVTPHAVLRVHSYLEKNLGDPASAEQVQEALFRLVECLCAATRIKIAAATPEALLIGARRLLRDPHTLPGKLASMRAATSDEAKALAPFLLSTTAYVPVREKEVNTCYEALHAWLSAFYFYSLVADQAGPVAHELSKQEKVLLRMRGHVDDSHSACSSQPNSMAGSPRNDRPPLTRPRGADLTTPLCRSRASLAPPATAAAGLRASAAPGRSATSPKPSRPLGVGPSASQTQLRLGGPMRRSGATSPSSLATSPHASRPAIQRRVSHTPAEVSSTVGSRSPVASSRVEKAPVVSRQRRFEAPSTASLLKKSTPQRAQSDRVLTQALQSTKLRSSLKETAPDSSPTCSMTPAAPARPPTILERRSSLPETLLQSIHSLRSLTEEASKDDWRVSWNDAPHAAPHASSP